MVLIKHFASETQRYLPPGCSSVSGFEWNPGDSESALPSGHDVSRVTGQGATIKGDMNVKGYYDVGHASQSLLDFLAERA